MKFLAIFLFSFALGAETRIIVISDLNGSYGSINYSKDVFKTVEKILAKDPDLVISTGDMIAGQRDGLDYFSMWESFHKTVTWPLVNSGIPFAITPGNHDGSGYFQFRYEREIFKNQWKGIEQKLDFIDQSFFPLRYSFFIKNILLISLDATKVGSLGDEQMEWLENQLKMGKNFKYKVIFGHLPLFPVAQGRENEFLSDQKLIRLLNKFKANIYLSGHHHAFYPGVYEGIGQISQGCLGSGPRRLIGSGVNSKKSFTEIIFRENGDIEVEAFEIPSFKKVDWGLLPEKIIYKNKSMSKRSRK